MNALLGGSILITYILALFVLALVIAWIILPFALIGTKPLLRELIKQTKETNRLLMAGREYDANTARNKERITLL